MPSLPRIRQWTSPLPPPPPMWPSPPSSSPRDAPPPPGRVVTFSSVHHLTVHVPGNTGGGDVTRLYYLGLRGEFTPAHRHGVTICNYELRPNAADVKEESLHDVTHQVQ